VPAEPAAPARAAASKNEPAAPKAGKPQQVASSPLEELTRSGSMQRPNLAQPPAPKQPPQTAAKPRAAQPPAAPPRSGAATQAMKPMKSGPPQPAQKDQMASLVGRQTGAVQQPAVSNGEDVFRREVKVISGRPNGSPARRSSRGSGSQTMTIVVVTGVVVAGMAAAAWFLFLA
jgi:hypothetical protein